MVRMAHPTVIFSSDTTRITLRFIQATTGKRLAHHRGTEHTEVVIILWRSDFSREHTDYSTISFFCAICVICGYINLKIELASNNTKYAKVIWLLMRVARLK